MVNIIKKTFIITFTKTDIIGVLSRFIVSLC